VANKVDRLIMMPLVGGLGNQLFQYAGGLAITKNTSAEIQFFDDLIRGSKVLKITPRRVAIENLLNKNIVTLGNLKVSKMLLKRLTIKDYWLNDSVEKPLDIDQISRNTRVISGYFQSRFLVDQVFDQVIDGLTNSDTFSPIVPKFQLNQITVHMRLGDKLTRKDIQYFGRTSVDYYLRGIRHLCTGDDYDSINIVSDQPGVARQLLNAADQKYQFNYSKGLNEMEDLALITHSRGIVMSCSSFSWWGAKLATLNLNTQVVGPSNWLKNPSRFDYHMNDKNWKLISKV
jgi:hypothetical protein